MSHSFASDATPAKTLVKNTTFEDSPWAIGTYTGNGTSQTVYVPDYQSAMIMEQYFGGMPLELLQELAKEHYPEYFI